MVLALYVCQIQIIHSVFLFALVQTRGNPLFIPIVPTPARYDRVTRTFVRSTRPSDKHQFLPDAGAPVKFVENPALFRLSFEEKGGYAMHSLPRNGRSGHYAKECCTCVCPNRVRGRRS